MHTYRCPFCAARVEVPTESVGHGVACTGCNRPFVAQALGGVLVEEVDGAWRPAVRGTGGAGESTVRTLHPEPFRGAPLRTLVLTVLALGGLVGAIVFPLRGSEGSGTTAALVVCLLLAVGAGLALLWSYAVSRFESLEITTRRSIWSRGILNRNVSEVEHEDIRNIQVQQRLTDRMLNVGLVAISSAGQDDMEISVRGLRDPEGTVAIIRRYQSDPD